MADDMTCTHGRLEGSCEDCAYEAAQAAGLPLGGPHPEQTRKAAEKAADGDTAPKAAARRKAS
jgi:hypothetical protein